MQKKTKKRLSLAIVLVLVAGFALYFLPRLPITVDIAVEFSEDIRPDAAALKIDMYQKGLLVKSVRKYYYNQNAPPEIKFEAKIQRFPTVVEIEVFADEKEQKRIYYQKGSFEFEQSDEYTFFIKRQLL